MVLAVDGLLEKKEKIPPELEIPEEEGDCYLLALCSSLSTRGALSLGLTRLGGIGTLTPGFRRCAGCCNNEQEFISINIANIKIVSIKEKI